MDKNGSIGALAFLKRFAHCWLLETKKKLKLSTPKKKSCSSNPHLICDKEVVIQLERLSDSVIAEMTAGCSALPPEQTKKKLKLSIQETSHPYNPHIICNKEVVIQIERLSESFVAEMTTSGSALPPEQVNELNDDALNINSFPNEIISEVFAYLEQNQLGQIARVCKRWNVLTKSRVLWKKVNVRFSPSHGCQTTVAESFINTLPSCVTSIRLHFTEYRRWTGTLDFVGLCVKLQEKCPHLEEYILIDTELSCSLPAVIYLCTQLLQDVKNLVFNSCLFPRYRATAEFGGTSKIEVLGLFNCRFVCSSKSPFSKMPHLKQLHLYGTDVCDSWFGDDTSFMNQLQVFNLGYTRSTARTFQAIQNHCDNLKELYLCSRDLQDNDLSFTHSEFPHLQTICIFDTYVTCEGVVSLIQSCPSLENVYVDGDVAESFAAHPFVVANKCKSRIVKAIHWMHNHNNY